MGEHAPDMAAALIGPRKPGSAQALIPMEYGHCEEHGQYPKNAYIDGRYFRLPEWCQPCAKQRAARDLLAGANIPPRFVDCTFESYRAETDDQRKALQVAHDYAERFDHCRRVGRSLVLTGSPGVGKNHLATAITKVLVKRGYSVMRVKAQSYLDAYWSKEFSEREEWMRDLARVDLLIIDEVGKSSSTEAAGDAFFRLIDARSEEVTPTLLISNRMRGSGGVDEFKDAIGHEAYDRLRQGGTTRLEMRWESYRGKA
jgi:DNA replication protein DnaC